MANDDPEKSRARSLREGILFAFGLVGITVETVAAVGFDKGPHWPLLVVFSVCLAIIPPLRVGDRKIDALRTLAGLDSEELDQLPDVPPKPGD